MKTSGAIVQGSLAVAGLLVAYSAWQKEPEAGPSDVVVLDVSKSSVSAIAYDDGKQHVDVARGNEGGEPVTWFTVTPKEQPAFAPDAGVGDGGVRDAGAPLIPAAVAAAASKPRQFRGNDLADKLWEKFAPLRGSRALGVLDPSKLKEVGLEKPDRTLTVTAGGARYEYQVGTAAQGAVNPYFRDTRDGKVFLVKGTLLTDLEFASSRLVDRRLHTFQLNEIDAMKVQVGDQVKEFSVSADGKVAPKGSVGSPDAFAKNWSDKVFRLIVTEVLGKDETPAVGAPVQELRVEYSKGGKRVGWIDLGHAGVDVFGRTEHTAGWMKMPINTGDTLTEGKKVAGVL